MFYKNFKISIKQKFLTTSILILIPIILFISFISFKILTSTLLNSSTSELIAKSKSAQLYVENLIENKKNISASNFIYEYNSYIADMLSERFNIRVQIFTPSAKLLYDTSNDNSVSMFNKDVLSGTEGNKAYIIENIENNPYIFLSTPIFYKGKIIGVFRFVYKDTHTIQIIKKAFLNIIIFASIALILGILLFYSFALKITKPIIDLTNRADEFSNNGTFKKISISSGDEVEVLCETFNNMASNIQEYIDKLENSQKEQKLFFDNISHEFKTPLTSIIGFSELIPEIADSEKINECSYYISKEGKRLLSLVEEILSIAKLERNNFDINKRFINIKDLLDETLAILSPKINDYHIIIENYCKTAFIYCDHDKTKQVFINIISNSIKYSGCEIISISSETFENRIEFYINDDGVGFDTKNPYSKSSTGFGLKICSKIMKNQNGEFKIESVLDKGTKATIIFFKNSKEGFL